MNLQQLRKTVAEMGYNVGFGAKKHFATFDIVEKGPGWIGFISLAIGIFGLIYESLSSKLPSATLAVLGISGLYTSFYEGKKSQYEAAGKILTELFNELRDLYRSLDEETDLVVAKSTLDDIAHRYYSCSISKQILFSDWYAHYKFFEQQQIGWVNEELHFKLRDKLPLSAITFLVLLIVVVVSAMIFLMRS